MIVGVIGDGGVGLEIAKILAQKEISPIILASQTFGKSCTSKQEYDLQSLIGEQIYPTLTKTEDYPDGREKRRQRRKQQRKNK